MLNEVISLFWKCTGYKKIFLDLNVRTEFSVKKLSYDLKYLSSHVGINVIDGKLDLSMLALPLAVNF